MGTGTVKSRGTLLSDIFVFVICAGSGVKIYIITWIQRLKIKAKENIHKVTKDVMYVKKGIRG